MKNKTYQQDGKEAFHILICLIQIWDYTKENFMKPPKECLEIAEVESVEISNNYQQLVDKAKIKFPRGTVIRKTSETVEVVKEEAKKVTATLDSRGVLLTTRSTQTRVAGVTDFEVGKRIRIYLGYTTDPRIASLPKFDAKRGTIFSDPNLHKEYFNAIVGTGPIFDGFITQCSIDTPIEIECENLATILKEYSVDAVSSKSNKTVNDFLAPEGKHYMLKDTGFELYQGTKDCKIDIGPVDIPKDLTVADVLTTWSKSHLYTYVYVKYNINDGEVDGTPYIVVGRSYFSLNFANEAEGKGQDSILQQRKAQGLQDSYEINFNYHVADNGLTLCRTNKDYLCIYGQCYEGNNKFFHISLVKNPDWHNGDPEDKKWRWINGSNLTKKRRRAGEAPIPKAEIQKYHVISYMSRKFQCTQAQLKQEMIQYYEQYNMNGIDGTLTIFGDLQLQSGCKVHLYDEYYPAKNGDYFVDEVVTKFGLGGFRQVIKLPYCIKRDSDENNQ